MRNGLSALVLSFSLEWVHCHQKYWIKGSRRGELNYGYGLDSWIIGTDSTVCIAQQDSMSLVN